MKRSVGGRLLGILWFLFYIQSNLLNKAVTKHFGTDRLETLKALLAIFYVCVNSVPSSYQKVCIAARQQTVIISTTL